MIDLVMHKGVDTLVQAEICSLFIRAMIENDEYMVIYQPEIGEITIIGPSDKEEQKVKDLIVKTFERGWMGQMPKLDPESYVSNLKMNGMLISEEEIATIINEFAIERDYSQVYIT